MSGKDGFRSSWRLRKNWRDINCRLEEASSFNGSLLLAALFDEPIALDVIDGFTERYRKRSLSTCEECGRSGRLRLGVDLIATLCDDHADYAAPFLPEDGTVLDLPPFGVNFAGT